MGGSGTRLKQLHRIAPRIAQTQRSAYARRTGRRGRGRARPRGGSFRRGVAGVAVTSRALSASSHQHLSATASQHLSPSVHQRLPWRHSTSAPQRLRPSVHPRLSATAAGGVGESVCGGNTEISPASPAPFPALATISPRLATFCHVSPRLATSCHVSPHVPCFRCPDAREGQPHSIEGLYNA